MTDYQTISTTDSPEVLSESGRVYRFRITRKEGESTPYLSVRTSLTGEDVTSYALTAVMALEANGLVFNSGMERISPLAMRPRVWPWIVRQLAIAYRTEVDRARLLAEMQRKQAREAGR